MQHADPSTFAVMKVQVHLPCGPLGRWTASNSRQPTAGSPSGAVGRVSCALLTATRPAPAARLVLAPSVPPGHARVRRGLLAQSAADA
jgi:hypothetical protein